MIDRRGVMIGGAALVCFPSGAAASCWHVPGFITEMGTDDLLRAIEIYRVWMIDANRSGVVEGSRHGSRPTRGQSLKGLSNRKFLHYERQSRGINLGWTNSASQAEERAAARWIFVSSSGEARPIRYGEPIAIGWPRDEPYLRYQKRNWGINLVWSARPSFEWMILGGRHGTTVRTGRDRIVLFNLTHAEPMIHFDRTVGANIGWPDSEIWLRSLRGIVEGGDPNCQNELGRAAARALAGVG
jgi:hypothetical protein